MNTILIALVATALFYLGSRAELTRALWSRYPARFASFMDCSACTGFWYGTVLAATVGCFGNMAYLGLDLNNPWSWPIVGLASIVTTPIVAGLMQRGIDSLGVAAPVDVNTEPK
jgi:hypothetical protein